MFLDELVTSDNVLPIDTVNLTQRSFFFPFRSPSSGDSPPLYSPPFSNPTVHLSTI